MYVCLCEHGGKPVNDSEQVFGGVCCRCAGQQVVICFLCDVEYRLLAGCRVI